MTPQDLEQLERTFDRARLGASGPQAMADWARENAPRLFAQARLAQNGPAFGFDRDPLAALRPLYPGAGDQEVRLDELAADDIRALRADRARRAGTDRDVTPETALRWPGADTWIEALRPFAALGAPVTLRTIERAAAAQGIEWDRDAVVHIADEHGVCVARVTVEQAERAHELINQADGGGGA